MRHDKLYFKFNIGWRIDDTQVLVTRPSTQTIMTTPKDVDLFVVELGITSTPLNDLIF